MKWKIKFVIYGLLAGTINLMSSCQSKMPHLTLLATKEFTDFPSASAIEFYNNKLYLLGDDASSLLVLDTQFNVISKVSYFPDSAYRISKSIKPDIESATLLNFGERSYLYAFGSLSGANRKCVYSFPLDSLDRFVRSDYNPTQPDEIKEWNIEGAAFVADQLVLANRANTTHTTNYLVLVTFQLRERANNSTKALKLVLPKQEIAIGISGLYYLPEKDILFFTASEEDTPNAFADGAIGNSYLGWIRSFSSRLLQDAVKPDALLNLTEIAPVFRQQKIESVCVECIENDLCSLYLAADNDNGQSRLFKMQLSFQ